MMCREQRESLTSHLLPHYAPPASAATTSCLLTQPYALLVPLQTSSCPPSCPSFCLMPLGDSGGCVWGDDINSPAPAAGSWIGLDGSVAAVVLGQSKPAGQGWYCPGTKQLQCQAVPNQYVTPSQGYWLGASCPQGCEVQEGAESPGPGVFCFSPRYEKWDCDHADGPTLVYYQDSATCDDSKREETTLTLAWLVENGYVTVTHRDQIQAYCTNSPQDLETCRCGNCNEDGGDEGDLPLFCPPSAAPLPPFFVCNPLHL